MNERDIEVIENRIGYQFENKDLLRQAFVRRSYSKENGGENNEVLEFIGDKVLDFIVVKLLAEKYGYYASECDDYDESEDWNEFVSEYQENKLSEIKKKLTEKTTLAKAMDDLGLEDYLIMGRGDKKNNIQNEPSVKEDLFEAIIGAVALDSSWNIDDIQNSVEFMLNMDNYLNDGEINYISEIQNWTLKRHNALPAKFFKEEKDFGFRSLSNSYTTNSKFFFSRMVKWENPLCNYCFTCELFLSGVDYGFGGRGMSKRQAFKDACNKAYDYLNEQGLLYTIADEIDEPSRDMAINQLEILARRGYFSIPTYEFFEEHDKNGNPIWRCECHINEREYYFYETSSSKKDAKKGAAYSMLLYVLGIEEE